MVGILTFHRAVNYGTLLQTYALQCALRDNGYENEVIDYRCRHIEILYSPVPNVSVIHARSFLRQCGRIPIKYKKRKVFDAFIREYLQCSKPMSREELREACKPYEKIITGSDQVWHLTLSGGDLSFALDFVDEGERKVSYAASIGLAQPKKEYLEILKPALEDFSVLSVREPCGCKVISEIVGRAVNRDIDPTFLVDRKEWEKLAQNHKNTYSQDYVFVYLMQPSDILMDVAEKLAENNGLKIYSILMTPSSRKIGTNVEYSGVNDFLWLIQNAKYVVTNSFHGIALSLRFHKDFFWAYQIGSHMSNPRFDMLTEDYGIDRRRCDTAEMIDSCRTMDWDAFEQTLAEQRAASIEHIHQYMK